MFEYPLDLHCSQTIVAATSHEAGLNTLWIYTALKLKEYLGEIPDGLNTLWIYTALKLAERP